VDPKAGLEYMKKRKFLTLPGLELLPLSRPGCRQSLYLLSYSGSNLLSMFFYDPAFPRYIAS
jgi:hypothetical protein